MKNKVIIILLLLSIIVIPKSVFAEEYTFEIGEGKEWNETNIEQLQSLLSNLQSQDMQDNLIENKYIFNFADGNYYYQGSFSGVYSGYVEYNFGKGTYFFDDLIPIMGEHTIRGQGINETTLHVDSLTDEYEGSYQIKDMTLYMGRGDGIYVLGGNSYSGYLSEDIKPLMLFQNVVIYNNNVNPFNIEYSGYETIPQLIFDNVTFNLNNKAIRFRIYNDLYSQSKEKKIWIKNCNWQNIDFVIEGNNEKYKLPKVYVENSELNKLYAYNIDVDVDCNTTFKNGTQKERGTDSDDTFFEDSNSSIYEYYDESYPEYNATVTTSVCKNTSTKITSSMKLDKIEDEFGYHIDNTWSLDPEGIVEIKDDKIIPLAAGIVRISKEIDGENHVLVLTVEENAIINPKTKESYFIISIVFIALVAFCISLSHGNKKIKARKAV